jgi:parvulin-like peptidyl-prolyl isomerase
VRTSFRTAAVALVAVFLAACGPSGVGGDDAATVNGESIPRAQFDRIVNAQLEGPNVPTETEERDEVEREIQRNVLTTLIGVEIVAQLVEDQGLEVSDDELDRLYEEQVELAGGEEEFEEFLSTIGLDEEEYREVIVADLARREALNAEFGEEVTDEDVEAAYEERREAEFVTRSTRHILVDDEDEADEIVTEVEDGADFAELATERSTDEGSGAQGGDLGEQPRGAFVPEFDDAVWEAELGDLLGPIETEFGFHVIEVLDETEVAFEEAEPQLRAELDQQAAQTPELQAAFEEAYTEAEVNVGSGLGEWDPQLGQVVDPDAPEGQDGQGEVPGGEMPEDGGELDPEMEEELQRMLDEMEQEGVEPGGDPEADPEAEPDGQ